MTITFLLLAVALEKLGFKEYCDDAQRVFADCKEVAAKRRKQSSRLEHLGVPEEELLRQQQELFAKVSSFKFILKNVQSKALDLQKISLHRNVALLRYPTR